jgi:hypothetical protein
LPPEHWINKVCGSASSLIKVRLCLKDVFFCGYAEAFGSISSAKGFSNSLAGSLKACLSNVKASAK